MSERGVNEVLGDLRSRGLAEPRVLVLTGAGISAESGVPTFRGDQGYWREGSRNFHPMELATAEAFAREPRTVWSWYLHRRATCLAASPNAAHEALASFEARMRGADGGERFTLVTQNVDGLHVRAGSSSPRTFRIHGDLALMRCSRRCSRSLHPVSEELPTQWERDRAASDEEMALLSCPDCEGLARPHVLWFDESYDEDLFRFDSTIRAAASCDVAVVVGTAGQTNLPLQVGLIVAERGVPMIVVNREDSPFTTLARRNPRGTVVLGAACAELPPLLEALAESLDLPPADVLGPE